MRPFDVTILLCVLAAGAAALAAPAALALPPVPVPDENPVTEPKRVLGKILFWDEQLSADNTVACGTCHRPAQGGSDPRAARHPGADAGTIDDVLGSPGIAYLDADGRPREHPLFGREPQVTPRTAPSNFGALWAEQLFWDGRAGPSAIDPESGRVVVERGGALEAQVLATLANPAEMTHTDARWSELTAKLARVAPLGLATDLPADAAEALAEHPDYPSLFAEAYGDDAITAVRIAFAIASYERTLVADETPWDRYEAGDDSALGPDELRGWQAFRSLRCVNCHLPPLFTNNRFFNTGVRLTRFDLGRAKVTGDPEDAGDMKVPSLRNVALKPRLMHTGQFATLASAISFYRTGAPSEDRDSIPGGGTYTFNMSRVMEQDLGAFLANALTDPRVRAERYPFDRPRLRTERHRDDRTPPEMPAGLTARLSMPPSARSAANAGAVARSAANAGAVARAPSVAHVRSAAASPPPSVAPARPAVELTWTAPADDTGVVDYVVERNGRVIALTTATRLVDDGAPAGTALRYVVVARDSAANRSSPATLDFRLER